jgi:RimJ/RimL family protein N-acetyltransferase
VFSQIDENEYQRIRPLFSGLDHNLVIDSIMDGNTCGCLYANDPYSPTAALLWNRQEALFLAGDPGAPLVLEGLHGLLKDVIIPNARQRYIPLLSLQVQPDEWEPHLASLLEGLQLEKAYRRLYLLKQIGLNYRSGLMPGYNLQRIDEKLLDSDLVNREQVLGWIDSFWPSTTSFLEQGFGFCISGRYAIASWCLSVFTSGNRYELGVATDEAYRNHGFASLTAAACLEYCLLNELVPEWHCWEDNTSSIKVAEKIGLEQRMSYPAFRFKTGLAYHG